jgi:hypothetical protein
MRVFHVTPMCNLPGIRKRGLIPDLATGKRKAVYVVDEKAVSWAIAHVADRHGMKVNRLVIISLDIDENDLRRLGVPGVFYVERFIPVLDAPVYHAHMYLRHVEEDLVENRDPWEWEILEVAKI